MYSLLTADVEKRIANYEKKCLVGEGTYGEVYEALDKSKNLKVALKRMRIENKEEGIPITALREMCILKHIKHDNIVELYDIIQDIDKIYLIFEYVDYDLKKYLDDNKGMKDQNTIKSFSMQMLNALYHCNINRIIHRDLKPQNLLITKDNKVKLADFGLARMFGLPMGKMTHEIITLWYRPPEVLLGMENYTTKVDSWSVGCIIAEMYLNKPLFPGDSEIGQLFKIFQVVGTPNESNWPEVVNLQDFKLTFPKWKPMDLKEVLAGFDKDGIDLVEKLLIMDPDKRITIREAIEHPYFESMRGGNTNTNTNNKNSKNVSTKDVINIK